MIDIWCAGHAQTHDNVAGVASGHRDVAMTDKGRNRARTVLRERYANKSFDVVFTSDTQRAYDTARLILERRGIPVVRDGYSGYIQRRTFGSLCKRQGGLPETYHRAGSVTWLNGVKEYSH